MWTITGPRIWQVVDEPRCKEPAVSLLPLNTPRWLPNGLFDRRYPVHLADTGLRRDTAEEIIIGRVVGVATSQHARECAGRSAA